MKKKSIAILLAMTMCFCNNYGRVFADNNKQHKIKVEHKTEKKLDNLEKENEIEKKQETKVKKIKEKQEKEVKKDKITNKEIKAQKKSTKKQTSTPVNYYNISNKLNEWYFIPPRPVWKGKPAGINPKIKDMLEKYDAIWQAPQNQKTIYITMDAGYEYKDNTTSILDIAKSKNIKINFFITGDFIRQRPDLVKRMQEEGHLVCNHTNKHLNGPKALRISNEKLINDVKVSADLYKELTGKDMAPFMRPPEGAYSERELAILKDLGYRCVFWSYAYQDWVTTAQPSKSFALNKTLGQLHNGSVLLLHTVSTTNVNMLGELIDKAREAGYKIDTIDNIESK